MNSTTVDISNSKSVENFLQTLEESLFGSAIKPSMDLDGNIFLSGKVDEPEEKLKITKLAWETKGVRSVKSAISIKGQTNFKGTAKDVLITSQLRTALIFNKSIKATNYNIDTINGKTYIFGISMTRDEKKAVINETKNIYGLKEAVASIILVEDLSRNKN